MCVCAYLWHFSKRIGVHGTHIYILVTKYVCVFYASVCLMEIPFVCVSWQQFLKNHMFICMCLHFNPPSLSMHGCSCLMCVCKWQRNVINCMALRIYQEITNRAATWR